MLQFLSHTISFIFNVTWKSALVGLVCTVEAAIVGFFLFLFANLLLRRYERDEKKRVIEAMAGIYVVPHFILAVLIPSFITCYRITASDAFFDHLIWTDIYVAIVLAPLVPVGAFLYLRRDRKTEKRCPPDETLLRKIFLRDRCTDIQARDGVPWIAVADGYTARILDEDAEKVVREIHDKSNSIRTVNLISEASNTLITGGGGGDVKFWDLTTGNMLRKIKASGGWIYCRMDPSETFLITWGFGNKVQLWDVRTAERLGAYECPLKSMGLLVCVGSSGDKIVVSGGEMHRDANRIAVLDRETEEWQILDLHAKPVTALAEAGGTEFVASADREGRIVIWNTFEPERHLILTGHSRAVHALYFCCYSWYGNYLISGGEDRNVIIWDIQSSEPVENIEPMKILQGHKKGITAACVTPRNGYLLTASRDNILHVWDFKTCIAAGGKGR